jgi:hypothetical protein
VRRGNAARAFLLTSHSLADWRGPRGHNNRQHWKASVSRLYGAQQRALQDRFHTRRIAEEWFGTVGAGAEDA